LENLLNGARFFKTVFTKNTRDFFFRVCYALLIPAQRVDHGRNTRGPREEYAWNTLGIRVEYAWATGGIRVDHGRNTRFKQTVINDVLNIRFKRFNFIMEI
jgi:hypothetical protein